MKVLGIIAEYNPFHNGHLYHLKHSMEVSGADCSVAVMSGNFVQRGEPAMWDKRLRARIAVENGVDLVIELPFAYACNTAAEFARGAVSLLAGLDCVTDLAFGCEGELSELRHAANLLLDEPQVFRDSLIALQKNGLSYPAAISAALREAGEEKAAELLSQPNNILALEYIKQCTLQGAPFRLWGIPRRDDGYHSQTLPKVSSDTELPMASAGAMRAAWKKGEYEQVSRFLPRETYHLLLEQKELETVSLEDYYSVIAANILTSSPEELAAMYGVTGGMEHAMEKALRTSSTVEALISNIKTKRYTWTGISRALIQSMIGLAREDYLESVRRNINYAHVLAFNDRGQKLLAYIKKEADPRIPIFSNLSREAKPDMPEQILLKYDLLATSFYHLARESTQETTLYDISDLVLRPYHKK